MAKSKKSLKPKKFKIETEEKDQQKSLGLNIPLSARVGGVIHKIRKASAIFDISPFWKSYLVWAVLSINVFIYIVLYFAISESITELPLQIPFLFYFPDGEDQLIPTEYIWYIYSGFLGTSLFSTIFAGRFYSIYRNIAEYVIIADVIKSILFCILIFKTFSNYI